ncbi:MAG: lipopolysaccharide heptosyltransferase II [Vicinamibacterales bacterium]
MSDAVARAVVVAPNWLGDAVMALPALQSLRARHPGAHLAVAARPSVQALFAMVPGVDGVVALGPRPPLTRPGRWRDDAARLADGAFDLALLLPNSFLSAWTAARARIPERWGYAADFRRPWLTRAVGRPRGLPHQADYYLRLTTALGLPPAPRVARVVPPAASLDHARGLVPSGPFVVLAPGAAYGRAKQWPPARYAELARDLWRRRGLPSVIVGAGADRAAGDELLDAFPARSGGTGGAVVDLIGRTDLPTLAGVLSLARAVVANDSGAMHLAAAVGAPVIAVFGATNEHHTAPLPAAVDAPPPQIVTHHVWCRPCMLRECPLGHQCMRGVTAAAVAALVP